MAALVRAKVDAGEYATESEVIRDGLRSLAARDHAVEAWLRKQVVPVAKSAHADPKRALTAAQVRKHMAQRRKIGRMT